MSDEPGNLIQEVPPEPEQTPRAPRRLFTRQEKIRYFLIGFLGWWLVNIALWLPLKPQMVPGGEGFVICGLPIIFGMNVLVLIVMAFNNRWIALGLLAAFAVNLVVSLVLGLVSNAICWIPFTAPLY